MVFVRPVLDESQLQVLNTLKLNDMRPEFVRQFRLFKDKIFSECPAKLVHGKPVTGRMLSNLLDQYVKAINEGAVPNISTAWDAVVDIEIRRAYEIASKMYQERIDKLIPINDLPIESDVLIAKLYVNYIHLNN